MIPRLVRNPIKFMIDHFWYLPTPMFGSYLTLFCQRFQLSTSPVIPPFHRPFSSSSSSSSSSCRYFSKEQAANDLSPTQSTRSISVERFIEGCDYEHWLVVLETPEGNPLRDEIIDRYIKTLAVALGSSVEEAKKSIYSVSTKYYYAFGCKVSEKLTHKIKSLSNVKWVLPDSYLNASENDYGGEPFVDGKVVPYEEKYHADWLRNQNDTKYGNHSLSKSTKRK